MQKRNIGRVPLQPSTATKDRKFVAALARGMQILVEFENEGGLGNREIAERTGLPQATVTRLT